MSSFGRKLARQSQRNSEEGKEQLKQEKADKQAAQPQQHLRSQGQNPAGYQPHMRIRQRRSGSG